MAGEAANNFTQKFEKDLESFNFFIEEIENCVLFIANCCGGYKNLKDKIFKEINDELISGLSDKININIKLIKYEKIPDIYKLKNNDETYIK